MTQSEESLQEENKRYVQRKSKYQDTKDSAFALSVAGGIGLLLLLLSFLDIIPFSFDKMPLAFCVIAVLSLVFIGLGVYSFFKSRTLKKEADQETEVTEILKKWMLENIKPDLVSAAFAETEADLYFERCRVIKERICEAFGELEDGYLDSLIDELYSELFPEE